MITIKVDLVVLQQASSQLWTTAQTMSSLVRELTAQQTVLAQGYQAREREYLDKTLGKAVAYLQCFVYELEYLSDILGDARARYQQLAEE